MSFFAGQTLLKISLDTKLADLSNYNDVGINYKRPDGISGTWAGTISGSKIEYQLQEEDSPQEGTYLLQAWVDDGGLKAYGDTVKLQFIKRVI